MAEYDSIVNILSIYKWRIFPISKSNFRYKYIDTDYISQQEQYSWGRENINYIQAKKLNFLLAYVAKHSKFYNNYTSKKLLDFPIMNKETMLDNFDYINTKNIRLEEAYSVGLEMEKNRKFKKSINGITIGLSSGTSGKRGVFLVSPLEEAKWTGKILYKMLPNGLEPEKIALFLRSGSNLYNTINSRKIKFKFFDLCKPFDELIIRLEKYDPSVLVAPTQVLIELSKLKNQNKLFLNPKKIISAAEKMTNADRKFIQDTWKTNVHEIYQATEGFIGCTCRCGKMHLNEEDLIIEKHWLNAEHTKFNPIITDLNRTSQPIIRYILDDILTTNNHICECGNPSLVISEIDGRMDDVLIFDKISFNNIQNKDINQELIYNHYDSIDNYIPNPKKFYLFSDVLHRIVLNSIEPQEEYLITQKDNLITLTANSNNIPRLKENIIKYLSENNVSLSNISWNCMQETPKKDLYIKRRRIQRL